MPGLGDILKGIGRGFEFLSKPLNADEIEEARKRQLALQEQRQSLESIRTLAPILQGFGPEELDQKRSSQALLDPSATDITPENIQEQVAGPGEGFSLGLGEGIDTILRLSAPPDATPEQLKDIGTSSKQLAQALSRAEERQFDLETNRLLRRGESTFAQGLNQSIESLKTLTPIEQAVQLKGEMAAFLAMEPLQFDANKRRALLDHNLALQRQAAAISQGRLPSPASHFESLADGQAQEMADDPKWTTGTDEQGNNVTVAQYRQELLGRTLIAAQKWGAPLPSAPERQEAIMQATRFYNPKILGLGKTADPVVQIGVDPRTGLPPRLGL